MRSALLMGAGDIASLLAPLLMKQGFEVIGARRNPARLDVKWPVLQADATRRGDWQTLLRNQPKVIVLTLTPSSYSDEGYRQGYVTPVQTLCRALDDMPTYEPQVIFVSSTSVYGQLHGEWIDENSPVEPTGFAGERVLQAEQALTNAIANPLVVRLSGIYGPGRERMVSRLLAGQVTVTPAWTNRIHSEDCAAVLAHLIDSYHKGLLAERLYLASDDLPIRQDEFIEWLAARLDFNASDLPRSNEPGPRGSKRCNNARLHASGYEFKYPTFREGYRHV